MDPVGRGSATMRNPLPTLAGRGVLLALIAAGIAFRLLGLGWGIPRPLPPGSTNYRNSFHMDEDNYLQGLSRTAPRRWDFDVRDYHWGTLQFYLVAGALHVAHLAGYLPRPWRESFVGPHPEGMPRVYIAGRAVSALAGILTLVVVFGIGHRLKDADTGLAAAAFAAVAPLHVLNSHFLTSDVTMVLLLLASFYFFVLGIDGGGVRSRVAGLFSLGLAISAKYNAAFLIPLWLCRDLGQKEIPFRHKLLGYGALAAGFIAGEPYALVHPRELASTLYRANVLTTDAMRPLLLPWGHILLQQADSLLHFGLQWTLAIPALIGLVFCLVRPSGKRAALAGSVALMTASLVAARWPMIRYTLPIIPLAAIAAALFVAEIPVRNSSRPLVVAGLALLPGLVSYAQVCVLTTEHPANVAFDWVQAHAAPGNRVGQIWPEVPPLDARRYRVEPLEGLFAGEGAPHMGQEYLILDNLPIQPFSGEFVEGLRQDYVLLAEFRSDPRVGRWVLDEGGAPHDWKYTHPVVRIYGRRLGKIAAGAAVPARQ